jgi:general secretion pathway protein N
MPTRYAWIALGVGAYAAFAMSLFPAATAYRLFAPEEMRLAGIDGTLWSGRAPLGSAGALPLHDISWNLNALPLLAGRLSGRLQARLSEGFVDTSVSATSSRVVFSELRASTSLAALRPLLQLQGTEGLVSLSMSRLQLDDVWPTHAAGQVRLAQLAVVPLMSSGGGELISIGGYDVNFADTEENGIAARIVDSGGPLEVSGTLLLDSDRNYALEGLVAPRAGAPSELIQGLQLMTGEPNADGKRTFSLTGSL